MGHARSRLTRRHDVRVDEGIILAILPPSLRRLALALEDQFTRASNEFRTPGCARFDDRDGTAWSHSATTCEHRLLCPTLPAVFSALTSASKTSPRAARCCLSCLVPAAISPRLYAATTRSKDAFGFSDRSDATVRTGPVSPHGFGSGRGRPMVLIGIPSPGRDVPGHRCRTRSSRRAS